MATRNDGYRVELQRIGVVGGGIIPAELPPDEMEQVHELRESYDYYHHLDTEAGHADLVPDDLIPHFALAGTPEECRSTLEKLDQPPVDQVAIVPFTPVGGDRADTMRTFAELVASLPLGV